MIKKQYEKINGVLLLDKAYGISSNHALQQVKHSLQAKKAGHTGTLDPLATGLLPICLGEATKFAQYLIDHDKTYQATFKLGEATSTGDIEGEIIQQSDRYISLESLEKACQNFTGIQMQTPPMYSALKFEGKPLYEYARKGIEIERQKREITIHSLKIRDYHFPFISIEVSCSKGTYIRTLCEDIAKHCGSFAHLTELKRTQTGLFHLSQSIDFVNLEKFSLEEKRQQLLPCEIMVQQFKKIILNEQQLTKIKQGQIVHFTQECEIIAPLSVFSEFGVFCGLVTHTFDTQSIKALRLISTE